jgi:hypothetical protein
VRHGADILLRVTTTLAHLVRRTSVVLVAGGLVLAVAGPAGADVPEGWSPDAEPVSALHAVLVLAGIPLLLFALITLAVVLPGVVKGERFTPGGQATEDQWFGGPSKGTAELPAPDTEESKAGGASGRW